MSLAVVPCEPRHLIALERSGTGLDTRQNLLGSPGSEEILRTYARALVSTGEINTKRRWWQFWKPKYEQRVIGVVGVLPLWAGRGYAFAMLSELAFAHGLSMTRATKKALDYAETDLGFKRIEAAVELGYGAGLRWIEALGFQYEGTMKNFGPGGVGEFYLYARYS